jgi:hypothetical protein
VLRFRKLLKQLIASLALLLIIVVGASTVFRAAISGIQRTDFTVYQLAGRAVLDGTDIYEVRNVRGWAYVYPPPFAVLMAPFAIMSVFWGALVWYLVSISLTAWAVLMCVRMVQDEKRLVGDPLVLAIVPVILVLVLLMSGLMRGQASVPLMWLVVAAFYFHRKKRDLLAGTCLAGAVLVKVFPVVLLAYFVWRRRWRFLIGSVVAITLGSLVLPAGVFGWNRNLQYLKEWQRVVAKPALAAGSGREQSALNEQLLDPEKLRNQSLEAVLWRLTGPVTARPMAMAIGLAMAGAVWLVGRRAAHDSELLIVSAILVWTLLVPPVSETHYFAMLLLPLTALTLLATKETDATTRTLTRAVLILFGAVSLVAGNVKPLQHYGPLCWATLALWAVLLLVVARRNQLEPETGGLRT